MQGNQPSRRARVRPAQTTPTPVNTPRVCDERLQRPTTLLWVHEGKIFDPLGVGSERARFLILKSVVMSGDSPECSNGINCLTDARIRLPLVHKVA